MTKTDAQLRLLDAAAALIPEVGWGNVTTRLVAERAGVPPGLVHYHFPSMHDLLTAAALRAARAMVTEPLPALIEAAGRDRGDDPASVLMAETFLAATRDERLRAELEALLGEFRATVAGWLRERGVSDADAVAVLLAAMLDGLVLHRAVDRDLDPAAVTATLERLLR